MKKTTNFILLYLFISGCTNLTPQIQTANSSRDPANNKWDYYNETPVHYTSFVRTKFHNGSVVVNENTDAFSAMVVASKNNDKAFLTMNGITVQLNELIDENLINKILRKRYGDNIDLSPLKGWDKWYLSEDQLFHLAINYSKNIVYTGVSNQDEQQDIAYYPSRYLACKKLWALNSENNSIIIKDLLKTALTAGIQSYTNYSTTSYYSNYGNFGYSQSRSYAWAGARSADALSTLFAGEYSGTKILSLWNQLNCF